MEAAGTAVRWQLCYDVTAKTWWMVSGGMGGGLGGGTALFWGHPWLCAKV